MSEIAEAVETIEDLSRYSIGDIMHDYAMLLEDFGPNDETVKAYSVALKLKGLRILSEGGYWDWRKV